MSRSQNATTIPCASDEEIQTVSDANVLNRNASDVNAVVYINDNDFNEDQSTSADLDIDHSFELCNNGPRTIEKLGDQSHATYGNVHIENSMDVLFGTKAIFNESVIIQQLVVSSSDGRFNNSQNHGLIPDNKVSGNLFCCCLRTNTDKSKCTFRTIIIAISIFSLISSMTVGGYFLYVHFAELYAGELFVCKTNGTSTCYIGSSSFGCSNLITSDDRPYISGHTASADVCKIYSRKNCFGDIQQIGPNHTIFDFDALSASC